MRKFFISLLSADKKIRVLVQKVSFAPIVCIDILGWQPLPCLSRLLIYITGGLVALTTLIGALKIAEGAFLIMTSQGNVDQIDEGKETLTAAVTGLLFAVLGIAILTFILHNFINETLI